MTNTFSAFTNKSAALSGSKDDDVWQSVFDHKVITS